MDAVLVRNADRMMLSAALQEDGIGLIFADGCRGVVPFVDLPEVGGSSGISGLELPNPYEMILITALGDRGRDSLGLRPPLLRPILPVDH